VTFFFFNFFGNARVVVVEAVVRFLASFLLTLVLDMDFEPLCASAKVIAYQRNQLMYQFIKVEIC
jgi:hypothetical protein